MTKKNFKTTFNDLLGGHHEEVEKKQKHNISETKSTFVVRCDHLDKIRAISYLEIKMIKDILADALEVYRSEYEKLNGFVQLPKK